MAEETIASLEALSILSYEHYQKPIQEKERLKTLSVKERQQFCAFARSLKF